MTTRQSRPEAALKAFGGAEASLLDRPCRCVSCRRVLTAQRSLRRGYGPECWSRQTRSSSDLHPVDDDHHHLVDTHDLEKRQMRRRRTVARLQLGAILGAVDYLSGSALLNVADALADVLDAIAGELR